MVHTFVFRNIYEIQGKVTGLLQVHFSNFKVCRNSSNWFSVLLFTLSAMWKGESRQRGYMTRLVSCLYLFSPRVLQLFLPPTTQRHLASTGFNLPRVLLWYLGESLEHSVTVRAFLSSKGNSEREAAACLLHLCGIQKRLLMKRWSTVTFTFSNTSYSREVDIKEISTRHLYSAYRSSSPWLSSRKRATSTKYASRGFPKARTSRSMSRSETANKLNRQDANDTLLLSPDRGMRLRSPSRKGSNGGNSRKYFISPLKAIATRDFIIPISK